MIYLNVYGTLFLDSAPEYVNPLRELTENRDKRLHVSGKLM